jgi:hypothetical protein
MTKITLHRGTMLASNASNHVPVDHLNAIPTSSPATTNAMKTSPWVMPKTLTPISVRGVPQVLEIHADQQTNPADGLGQRDRTEPASNRSKIKCARHERHSARKTG